MAQLAFGTAGYIGFIGWGQAGTVVLKPDYTTLTWTETQETADTTRGSLKFKTHIPTLKSWNWTLEMFFDDGAATAGGTASLYAFANVEQGTIMIGALGTAAGAPKLGGLTTITEISQDMAFSDPSKWTVNGDGNGTPAWNYGGTW